MSLQLTRVLISDEIDAQCADILREHGIEVVQKTQLSQEQLIAEIPKYDGLIVRSSTKVTADVLAAGVRLSIVGRAGTGVDNIACDEATRRGIIVMNTPGGNTLSATEHTCAMICSLAREIPEAVASLKAGKWARKQFMGHELYGKTLAIIGLGRIGRDVAKRMQAFGMKTIGYDPLVSVKESEEFGVEWLELDEIWPRCDYITVHTPLIPQTKNLINDHVFTAAPRGVRVVNVARGGIIDEDSLLKALNSGSCAGAALDVFLTEPPTNTDLLGHSKVICTPHLGANTHEAQTRVAIEIAEQFVSAAEGKSLYGAINAPAAADALDPRCEPLISLATCLGKLSTALLGGVQECAHANISTFGQGFERSGSYVSAAYTTGLLNNTTSYNLNLVNAPVIAKSLQLQITVTHKSQHEPAAGMSVTLTQQSGNTISLSGLVGPLAPLLTSIDNFLFDSPFTMKGHTLLVLSQDTSQFLSSTAGAITNGNHNCLLGVSISSAVGGDVWGLLRVASPISDTKPIQALSNQVISLCF